MRYLLILAFLFHLPCSAQQPLYYNLATGKYLVGGLSSDTKPVNPPDNCYFLEANTGNCFISMGGSWNAVTIGITQAAFDAKQATLVSGTNIKTINSNSLLGSGDLVLSGTGDLLAANNLSDVSNAATSRTNLGLAIGTNVQAFDADLTTWAGITPTTIGTNIVSLANPGAVGYIRTNADNTATHRSYANVKVDLSLDVVENTALSTWAGTANVITVGTIGTGTWNATAITDGKIASALTGKTYNGLTITSSTGTLTIANGKTATVNNSLTLAGTDGVTTTLPAVAGTVMLNTSTSGVGTSPTSSSTVTITHNLGRVPTIIRIYGIGTFTSNAAATPTPMSMGTFNSTGNRCIYMTTAGTTTQVGLSSTTFALFLATSSGNTISGVIGNLTSTQFDIVFTEIGTATAQVYLWEAQ